MNTLHASLLLSAAGFALLVAGSAHADAALETPIATADLDVAWLVEREPLAITRQYPARAERLAPSSSCSGELTLGAQKGYLYRNHGIDVANGEPTSQAAGKATCGDVSLAIGGSVLLSDGRDGIPARMQALTATGTGSERLANEAWVVLSYHPTIELPVGRVNLEGAVVYRANDTGQGVFASRDDTTELVARAGYAVSLADVDIELYLRSTKANPVGYANSLYWLAEGVKIDWRQSDGLSLHLDVTYEHNVNSVTAVVHRNVWYGTASFRKELPMPGWSLTAGVQFSQYANYDRQFDFIVERDGRLLKTRTQSGRSKSGFEYYPFASITRRF